MTRFLFLLAACAPAQLSPGQRMELIEQLDHSAAFAKKCGLAKSEMRVRFVALPSGKIDEPVIIMGPNGTADQAACVMKQLTTASVSPHHASIVVRTERLLPTGKSHTDAKLRADSSGLAPGHIEAVINAGQPAVKACTAKKAVHGNITMFFLIDPKGRVSDVLVESALGAPEVEWCLLEAFKTLHFEKPVDGSYVEVVRTLTL